MNNICDLRPRLIQRREIEVTLQRQHDNTYLAWTNINGKEIRRKGQDRDHAISRISEAVEQHFKDSGIGLAVNGSRVLSKNENLSFIQNKNPR